MDPAIPPDVLALVPQEFQEDARKYPYVLSHLALKPDGVPYINVEVRAPITVGRDWDHQMIEQTTFYVPRIITTLQPNQQYGYEFLPLGTVLLQDHAWTRGPGLDRWSYLHWERVRAAVETGQYEEVLNHLPYYSALFNVTERFGRPIDGGFITDLRNFVPVDPHDGVGEPPADTPDNRANADLGYAYWILGVRVALKVNPMDPESTMVESLARFLNYDINRVRQHLPGFGTVLKQGISTDKPPCHSNAAARRGMNINTFLQKNMEIHFPDQAANPPVEAHITGQDGGELNGWMLTNDFKPVCIKPWGPVFARFTDIPNFNPGFWGFAQIGIEHNGWSAMELVNTGMLKHDLTWTDLIKGFPTKIMMSFMNKVFQEEALCAVDPWRSTSRVLLPEINTPLSGVKNRIPSYIGICLNTPRLNPDEPPVPMNGVEVLPLMREIIASIVREIILHGGDGAIQPHGGIARLFGVDHQRITNNIQTTINRSLNRRPGIGGVLAGLNRLNPANIGVTTPSESVDGDGNPLDGLDNDGGADQFN